MKRAGNLWPRVTAFDNVLAAAREASRHKRYRPDVARFNLDLERNVLAIQRQLQDRTYQPGPYRTFTIREPKPRLISAAPFYDRVVHHALCRVLEPVLDRTFIHHSYACRKGRGNHRALDRFVRWCAQYPYVLVCDVRKFFPSIDHQVVKYLVLRRVKDPGVLWLLDIIIDASCEQEPAAWHFPDDDLLVPLSRRRGLPIGNLTSQVLANVVLDPVDHLVKEQLRVKGYLRYCDDMALFGQDKSRLHQARARMQEKLWSLRLRLNEGKSRVRRTDEGITWLGFRVLPGGRLRVKRDSARRFSRRLRRLREGLRAGETSVEDVTRSVQAWLAHAAHGDCCKLCDDILARAVF